MACVAPSAATWRKQIADWPDDYLEDELDVAWRDRPHEGADDYGYAHHDWTNFRTATLREARKRGLDISITGLGT